MITFSIELWYELKQHVSKLFYKSLLNSICLWSKARLAINKKQNYFLLPGHQFADNLILVSGFYEKKKKDESKIVTKFVEIIVTIIFM